ncbi:hypothetical protein ACFQH9_12140 [Pseudonocardia lutea]|uniref:Uncharacterized protein n=1 Tax=Pseudonocardia lutea TaxID=2172015 RepID=A0ABW1I9I5_9PSEU
MGNPVKIIELAAPASRPRRMHGLQRHATGVAARSASTNVELVPQPTSPATTWPTTPTPWSSSLATTTAASSQKLPRPNPRRRPPHPDGPFPVAGSMKWSAEEHTDVPVSVTAEDLGTDAFDGRHPNTYLHEVLGKAPGI